MHSCLEIPVVALAELTTMNRCFNLERQLNQNLWMMTETVNEDTCKQSHIE